ncbi:MAG TPA: mechanosensitive ion channel domain-containing protein [Acidimicrobiales bacterium]|nr:mechanosensitive ion channel domain-containing protein [Acidimicrobiales bacterium]
MSLAAEAPGRHLAPQRSGDRAVKLRHRKTFEVVSRARKYDWKVALASGGAAMLALVVGSAFGNIHASHLIAGVRTTELRPRIVAWSAAFAFLVFAVIATRRIAAALGNLVAVRSLLSAGAAVRLIVSAVGYLIIVFAEFGLLSVSIVHLLVGAGFAGIILGIAAQQSLGNVFASIVLLLARPFVVGDRIRVRSGTFGGPFEATVLGVSLTSVTLRTDEGPLQVPNSVMLATPVGRIDLRDEPHFGVPPNPQI